MSQENVEVVRKLFESTGSEFFELLDPHVVFINYASAPETRPYVGHDGVREWAAGFRATLGDYEIHVTEIIDAGGDQVVADTRVTGAGTSSGVPIDREMATLFTLVNGRIVRAQGFETRVEAREAAGLPESALSQENVQIVRNWVDSWVDWFNSRRDPDRLARLASEYMAPDVTYEEDPVWPDAGTYRGLAAVVRRFADYVDLVHIESVEAGEAIDAGDLVIAKVRIAMLGAGAGEAVEFLWTYTVRVENGRITHFRAWYDPEQAPKAAGLRD